MQNPIKSSVACGCAAAIFLLGAGCSPRTEPPMTVDELMQDRVALDGILMKCDQRSSKTQSAVECSNARIAIQRVASEHEPADEARRAAEFEHARERLRSIQEKRRLDEAKTDKVDAYHLPVIPVEAPTAAQHSP